MKLAIIVLSLIICISVVSSSKFTRAESLSELNPKKLKRQEITLAGKKEVESYFYMKNDKGSKRTSSWMKVKFNFTNDKGLINTMSVDKLIKCNTKNSVFFDEKKDGEKTGNSFIPWRKIADCITNTKSDNYMTLTIVDDGDKINNATNNVFIVRQYFFSDQIESYPFQNEVADRTTYCNDIKNKANEEQKKVNKLKQQVTKATTSFINNCNNQIDSEINKDKLNKQKDNLNAKLTTTKEELADLEKEKGKKEITVTNKEETKKTLKNKEAEIQANLNDLNVKLLEAKKKAEDAIKGVQTAQQAIMDQEAIIKTIQNTQTQQNNDLKSLKENNIPNYSTKIKENQQNFTSGITDLKGYRGIKGYADNSLSLWNRIKNTDCDNKNTPPIQKSKGTDIIKEIEYISTGTI